MNQNSTQNHQQAIKPQTFAERTLTGLIHIAELIGLFVIAMATIYAGVQEVGAMLSLRQVTLGDLLLLFLYLEVLAMVAIYLRSGKLPVRLPLYIAIIALARYLILEMKSLDEWQMVAIGVTITLITIATLILRYGHLTFPYDQNSGSPTRVTKQPAKSEQTKNLGTD